MSPQHHRTTTPLGRRRHAEGGFTLIELLVVIAILAVLAGTVVFAVGGATGDARAATCRTDLSALDTAATAYRVQHTTSATSLGQLVAAGYLRNSDDFQGNTLVKSGYRIQFTPDPTNLTPGTNTVLGIGDCGDLAYAANPAFANQTIRVAAATSLGAALAAAEPVLEAANPGLNIIVTTGSSGSFVAPINADPTGPTGTPNYDVFLSADVISGALVNDAKVLTPPATAAPIFVRNRLELVVDDTFPTGPSVTLADLNPFPGSGSRLVTGTLTLKLATPVTPVRIYAIQSLCMAFYTGPGSCDPGLDPNGGSTTTTPGGTSTAGQGWRDTLTALNAIPGVSQNAANVGAVLTAVAANGTADANVGFVYVTDALGRNDVLHAAVPAAAEPHPAYPALALNTGGASVAAINALIDSVRSGTIQTSLRAFGFQAP